MIKNLNISFNIRISDSININLIRNAGVIILVNTNEKFFHQAYCYHLFEDHVSPSESFPEIGSFTTSHALT